MIGRLNHVAIAVRDLAKASAIYRDVLGANVSEPVPQPDHGVTTVFITLPNTKLELISPLGADSPIAKFMERMPEGGIHHVCYEVDDIVAAREALREKNVNLLLTDINLPDGSCLDLAREALAQNPRLPVIVCSGQDVRDVALLLGPTAHPLRKPFELDELEALVERLAQ